MRFRTVIRLARVGKRASSRRPQSAPNLRAQATAERGRFPVHRPPTLSPPPPPTQNEERFKLRVARSGGKRDGKHIEEIGSFDPNPGRDGNARLALDASAARRWISVGAAPTAPVAELLRRAGILPDARAPDRASLAAVGPAHPDAGAPHPAGPPSSSSPPPPGLDAAALALRPPSKRAAAVWAAARRDGTWLEQQRSREAAQARRAMAAAWRGRG